MEFQEGRGAFEVALLLAAALGLDFADVVQGFLELAGESLVVQTEGGEGAVGVDDVEVDRGLLGGWVGGAVEEGGFEQGDAVEAPGGVGEFLGELGLGGGGGLIFVGELAAVELVGGGVLGSEDGGVAGKAVGEGILGRALFAGGGAWAGGEEGVCPIYGGAMAGAGDWRLGVRDGGGNRVCHGGLRLSCGMGGRRFYRLAGGCCWMDGED